MIKKVNKILKHTHFYDKMDSIYRKHITGRRMEAECTERSEYIIAYSLAPIKTIFLLERPIIIGCLIIIIIIEFINGLNYRLGFIIFAMQNIKI